MLDASMRPVPDGVPGEMVRLAIMSTDAEPAVLFVAEFRLA